MIIMLTTTVSDASMQMNHAYATNTNTNTNNTTNNTSHHINKKLRAGSVSGRLRTASDLEELGYIDKNQKGVIKDLIISGNADVQKALDKYRLGDHKELEDMIRQGEFSARRHSIDLLEGLDLEYLQVPSSSSLSSSSLSSSLSSSSSSSFTGSDWQG